MQRSAVDSHTAAFLIADTDAQFARDLQRALAATGFAAEHAASGADAIAMARASRPAVVLTETHLPDISGYEVCGTLRAEFGNGLAVAFVSATRTDDADVSAGLMIGADDYITKPCNVGVVVARARSLLRRARVGRVRTQIEGGRLTRRELEVLGLLSDGLSQKEIAARLSISPSTVARHVENIMKKLDVRSRAHAVSVAYRQGLFQLPPHHGGVLVQ